MSAPRAVRGTGLTILDWVRAVAAGTGACAGRLSWDTTSFVSVLFSPWLRSCSADARVGDGAASAAATLLRDPGGTSAGAVFDIEAAEAGGDDAAEVGAGELDVDEPDVEEADVEEADVPELDDNEFRADELRTDELRTDELCADELCADELWIDELWLDEPGAGELCVDELCADVLCAGELRGDELRAVDCRADESCAGELRAEEFRADVVDVADFESAGDAAGTTRCATEAECLRAFGDSVTDFDDAPLAGVCAWVAGLERPVTRVDVAASCGLALRVWPGSARTSSAPPSCALSRRAVPFACAAARAVSMSGSRAACRPFALELSSGAATDAAGFRARSGTGRALSSTEDGFAGAAVGTIAGAVFLRGGGGTRRGSGALASGGTGRRALGSNAGKPARSGSRASRRTSSRARFT